MTMTPMSKRYCPIWEQVVDRVYALFPPDPNVRRPYVLVTEMVREDFNTERVELERLMLTSPEALAIVSRLWMGYTLEQVPEMG